MPKITAKRFTLDKHVAQSYRPKERARNYGLDPAQTMTLKAVTQEKGVTYYEFTEVIGTKWPASLFYLV